MLNFIYNWGGMSESARRLCWSGTPYSIFIALKKLTNVNDLVIAPYVAGIGKKLFYKVRYGNGFSIPQIRDGVKKINAMNLTNGTPCLMFGEYISKYIADSYVYQDCTVDYIVRLHKEGLKISQYSPMPENVNTLAIAERLNNANKFNHSCKGIFTMSEWLAKDLIENSHILSEKVHPVGGGCNINLECVDHSKKEGNRFLFIGKAWKRKNGPLVVAAFKKLRQKYSDIELYVAGPVDEPSEINGEEGIFYLGQLSYDQLIEYYNLCDFFVMPSQFEAYGLVFAEALIYGLPCVGKNCFAMPEFIKDGYNGYLINTDDTDELCKKMELLFNNREMAKNVMSNMEYYKDKYSWDSVAKRMMEVFRQDGYAI